MAPTIRVKDDLRRRLRNHFGVETDTEVAEKLRMDRTQYSRVIRGESFGVQSMALLLVGVPEFGFADLFEIVNVPEPIERVAS